MKKSIVLVMCALGVFAMLGTSCKKDENKAGKNFTYNIIEMEDEDFDGRVFIDPFNQPKWQNTDVVRVYNVDENDFMNTVSGIFYATSEDGATVTDLTGNEPVGEMQTCYMAYYPGDNDHVTGVLAAGNKETFTLDATQYAQVDPVYFGLNIDRKALAMASRIDEGSHFPFKAIAGVARLKLRQASMVPNTTTDENGVTTTVMVGKYCIDKIELTDNQWTLNGKVAVDLTALNSDDITTMTNSYKTNGINQEMLDYAAGVGYEVVESGTKTIMLDCTQVEEEYRIPNASTAKYFYFGLRPFALGEGFVVKIYCHETLTGEKFTHVINNWNQINDHAYTVEPNRIKGFNYVLPENLTQEEW